MDLILELWLAFVSIAFLIETSILIGKYLQQINFEKFIRKIVLITVFSLLLGVLGGFVFSYFRENEFILMIIYVIWAILLIPFFYIIANEKPIKEIESSKKNCKKDFNSICEEDTIVFNHLIDRNKRLFSDVDALDTKFSQIIALNGLILSFAFVKTGEPAFKSLFLLGIAIILSSMIIGISGFFPRAYFTGPPSSFYIEYDNLEKGEGIKKLKGKLLKDYPINLQTHSKKIRLFIYMLTLLLIGLFVLVVSYYGKS